MDEACVPVAIKKEPKAHSECHLQDEQTETFSKTFVNEAARLVEIKIESSNPKIKMELSNSEIKNESSNPSILSRLFEGDAACIGLKSTCAICQDSYNPVDLLSHVCKTRAAFQCVVCGKTFCDHLEKYLRDHNAVPDKAVSDNAVPDNSAPDNAVSDNVVSDNVVPDNSAPDNAVPHVIKVECGVRGRAFNGGSALETHRKQHEGDTLLDCSSVLTQVCGLVKGVRSTCKSVHQRGDVPTGDNMKPAKSEILVTLKCGICGKVFQYLKSYNKHIAAHDAAFSRSDCGKAFILEQHLKTHMDADCRNRQFKEATSESSFLCEESSDDDMNVVSDSSTESQDMELECTPHEVDLGSKVKKREDGRETIECLDCSREWLCKRCDLTFQSKEEITRHRKIHSGRKHHCVVCDFHCRLLSELDEHFKTHEYMAEYHCKVCEKAFLEIRKLFQHYKTHAEYRRHTCDVCGAAFPRKSTLQLHLRHHTGERPFRCAQCQKTFIDSSALRSHMISHSRDRKYECRLCGKAFAYKNNLVRHTRIHTQEKPFKCCHCSDRFAQSVQLTRHLRRHTGEKPYKCEECGARFTYKETWHSHSRLHSEEEYDIRCEMCSKTFASGTLLKRHVKTVHFGQKDFMCHQCGTCFPRKEVLSKHFKSHESDSPNVSTLGYFKDK